MKPAEISASVKHPALTTIDLASAEKEIVAALDSAFSEVGFCICNNAYLDPGIQESAFAASRAFHKLPESVKNSYAINSAHRGYISPKSSTSRTSQSQRSRDPTPLNRS